MTNREKLEAEVLRITSPKARPMIIERPDGTEIKLHIRAISFKNLENATAVISQIIHGSIYGAFKAKEMGRAIESAEDFDAANIFTEEVVRNLRDKLLSFLPWFIGAGTDITFDAIRDEDYLVTLEILIEIVRFNFGARLLDFFSRALAAIGPLVQDKKMAGLADGLLSSPSSSIEDMTAETSADGASES